MYTWVVVHACVLMLLKLGLPIQARPLMWLKL